MREVKYDSLAAGKPVAKALVVWFGAVTLHGCVYADVVNLL